MSSKEFAKIAVGLREHPKVLAAGDDAGWLFVCAILWSKEHDTDGFIPTYAASRLTGFRQYRNVLRKCVEFGLMEPRDDGWIIHDYLDHQESAERRRAAGRKAASVRWSQNEDANRIDSASGSHPDRNATAIRNRITEEEEEKEEDNPTTSSQLDEVRIENELFSHWVGTCGHPHAKFTRDRRQKVRARLREGYTPEQIRHAIDGAARNAFVNDAGKRFDDLELICRNGSKLEDFIGRAGPTQAAPVRSVSSVELGAALRRASEGNCGDAA